MVHASRSHMQICLMRAATHLDVQKCIDQCCADNSEALEPTSSVRLTVFIKPSAGKQGRRELSALDSLELCMY